MAVPFNFNAIDWKRDDPVSIIQAYRDALTIQERQRKRRQLEYSHQSDAEAKFVEHNEQEQVNVSGETGAIADSKLKLETNSRKRLSDSPEQQQQLILHPQSELLLVNTAPLAREQTEFAKFRKHRRIFSRRARFPNVSSFWKTAKDLAVARMPQAQAQVQTLNAPRSNEFTTSTFYVDSITQTDSTTSNGDLVSRPVPLDVLKLDPARRKRPGYFSADFDDFDETTRATTTPTGQELTRPATPTPEPEAKRRKLFSSESRLSQAVSFKLLQSENGSGIVLPYSPRRVNGESDISRRRQELERLKQLQQVKEKELEFEKLQNQREAELEQQRVELERLKKLQDEKSKELERKEQELAEKEKLRKENELKSAEKAAKVLEDAKKQAESIKSQSSTGIGSSSDKPALFSASSSDAPNTPSVGSVLSFPTKTATPPNTFSFNKPSSPLGATANTKFGDSSLGLKLGSSEKRTLAPDEAEQPKKRSAFGNDENSLDPAGDKSKVDAINGPGSKLGSGFSGFASSAFGSGFANDSNTSANSTAKANTSVTNSAPAFSFASSGTGSGGFVFGGKSDSTSSSGTNPAVTSSASSSSTIGATSTFGTTPTNGTGFSFGFAKTNTDAGFGGFGSSTSAAGFGTGKTTASGSSIPPISTGSSVPSVPSGAPSTSSTFNFGSSSSRTSSSPGTMFRFGSGSGGIGGTGSTAGAVTTVGTGATVATSSDSVTPGGSTIGSTPFASTSVFNFGSAPATTNPASIFGFNSSTTPGIGQSSGIVAGASSSGTSIPSTPLANSQAGPGAGSLFSAGSPAPGTSSVNGRKMAPMRSRLGRGRR
ncbi:uncharacterized protein V1516DRAFT_670119 [Lipomyces oligophaga]|uniref:uncharacterized protein n=1 Tax=Lipomyces oligophaga TaxID=45792 RepID=UPI0034CE2A60